MENVTIPKSAAICAAMHYIALFESEGHAALIANRPVFVDFGVICSSCPIVETCRGEWLDTVTPLMEAVGMRISMAVEKQPRWPGLVIDTLPGLSEEEDSQSH